MATLTVCTRNCNYCTCWRTNSFSFQSPHTFCWTFRIRRLLTSSLPRAHPTHLRVVIPSANLTPHDWGETGCLENVSSSTSLASRTNYIACKVCFLIDLPRLPDGQEADLKRLTRFGEELLAFLHAMGLDKAQIDSMRRFDFSRTAHLAFVHSM